MAAHRFKSENKDAEKQLGRYPCDVLGVLRDKEIKSAYPSKASLLPMPGYDLTFVCVSRIILAKENSRLARHSLFPSKWYENAKALR
ncbi:hypothetical protein F2Q70_00030870 [Brassica cretica]|uniref:Uncharacterized protein n=1 Tax=Brassica cretica TaxID=69181 RepID=A0A8S9FJC6_BRACR|nr:hypothetical protein F2Q70_00030870 [Brassica cretica]KAF2551195.1 hypothetical protein F2Q68_00035257 [Brassica cretica]